VKTLTTLTSKECWCDLIGVYLRFSNSRLVYAEAAKSFSTIVPAVLCRPALQFETSRVKISVNYFYETNLNVEININACHDAIKESLLFENRN